MVSNVYVIFKNLFCYSQFSAAEARLLRVAIGSFFDHLVLVVETIKEFGPPMESQMEQ